MKTVVLIVIIALGLGFTIRARSERRASESALGSFTVEHAALLRNVAGARQRVEAARDTRAALSVAAPAETPVASAAKSRKLSPEAALANHPALLAEYQQTYRHVPDWWLGRTFRAVGFSPQQIEQWKDLLMQANQRQLDLIAAVETQGLDRKSDTFKTLEAENKKFQREKEAEILGGLAPKYREYQRSQEAWNLAQWLARASIYSEASITGVQIERTAQILAANMKQMLRARDGTTSVVDWTVASVQLKDSLSPAQIAALQTVGLQFEKIAMVRQRVDERTNELTAQFKAQSPAK
ncbi:MAG: hypothetical protein HZA93_09625 [Verrucomicrobia bacterium]|nr:hypothetical protein [Verrucomicrobiota bacterium]